jgi:lysozyme family protein
MSFPFTELEPEYVRLLSQMRVTKVAEVNATAVRLLGYVRQHYAAVSAEPGMPPAAWLAAVGEREDGPGIFTHYFGNGDPLDRPTRDVPRGRGPFTGPNAFQDGLRDAIAYDHIGETPPPWTWPGALYKGEAWNGFGPREHGRHTGYLWSGTSIYGGGKYVRDNVWDPNAQDEQLGIVPVMLRMAELDTTLALAGPLTVANHSGIAAGPVVPPMPPPVGVHSAATLQKALNALGADPALAIDGSYGRRTAGAVRAFQTEAGLPADGIAGPATWAAITEKLMPAK